MLRTGCIAGHPLEQKPVAGGLLGIKSKHCRKCRKTLEKGSLRFSCKTCDFHLCAGCVRLPVCSRNHILEQKAVAASGSLLGMEKTKNCQSCKTKLQKGAVRFSCKACEFHECGPCYHAVSTMLPPPGAFVPGGYATAVAVPVAAPVVVGVSPSAPSAPGFERMGSELIKRTACKYGRSCYQKNAVHLEKFVHPGDRNYRIGFVQFEGNAQPEFDSLRELFSYHDPDESGHLSKVEFAEAMQSCEILAPGMAVSQGLEKAWHDIGGTQHGYVNFRAFVTWTQEHLQIEFPIGVEESSSRARPCRFRYSGGERCTCSCYEQSGNHAAVCKCGHKTSMHRSEMAQRTMTTFLEDATNKNWIQEKGEAKDGLVEVEDEMLLAKLQETLTKAHKPKDNWTRDRGCNLHGVNGCAAACASKNRKQVPTGYTLVTAYRNQNQDLWKHYSMLKTAIVEECDKGTEGVTLERKNVTLSGNYIDEPLDEAHNEWYMFHGTSAAKCKSICSTNFRLNMAGSGKTWKDPGKDVGTPLYGFGIYLAEHVTKSDEYCEVIPDSETFLIPGEDVDFYTVMLCRVLGGRTNVVTSNEIERDKLRADVFDGPYHSVFGDRVATLGKPYREVVVYDKDQCYPEFLLVYARMYD